jgi:hypothetical protein
VFQVKFYVIELNFNTVLNFMSRRKNWLSILPVMRRLMEL